MDHKKALLRAVEICGSQAELARRVAKYPTEECESVVARHVWNWINRDVRLQAEYVLAIERATNGTVTRHELRPDLYPRDEVAA